MKRLIFICLLLVAMTTAAFAGTGVTVISQGRTVNIEVTDSNIYNVKVLNESNRLTETRLITPDTGGFTINVPEGQDYITIIVVNICTGKSEKLEIPVK